MGVFHVFKIVCTNGTKSHKVSLEEWLVIDFDNWINKNIFTVNHKFITQLAKFA